MATSSPPTATYLRLSRRTSGLSSLGSARAKVLPRIPSRASGPRGTRHVLPPSVAQRASRAHTNAAQADDGADDRVAAAKAMMDERPRLSTVWLTSQLGN